MANNDDKDILITPNTGQSGYPNISFKGYNADTDGDSITMNVLDDNTLSFESDEGQVFSIGPVLSSGTIFSVNDISGVPSITVDADGTITLAPYQDGNIGIGLTAPTDALHIRAASDHPLVIENTTNAGYAGIQFSDNSDGSYAQKGELRFNHADGSSEGSGASFHFTTTESDLSIVGGKFIASDSAASEPGFSFSSDNNTGLFQVDADDISLVTVGSRRLTVTNGGEVLIGATSMGDTESKVGISGKLRVGDIANTQDGSARAYLHVDSGTEDPGGTSGDFVRLSTMMMDGGSGGNNVMYTQYALRNETGTSWTTLSIVDGVRVDTTAEALKADGVTGSNIRMWHEIDAHAQKRHWGHEDTTGMTYHQTGSGRLGIGTTSPDTELHVSSGNSGDCTVIIEADEDNNAEGDLPRLWFKADGGITEGAVQLSDNELDIIQNSASSGGIRFLTGSTSNTGTTDPATGASVRMDINDNGMRLGSGARVTTIITQSDGIGSNDNETTLPTSAAVKDYVDNNAGGIASVAADSTPQLGGDLDVNGNKITSASNADVTIEPNGTGDVNLFTDTVVVGDSNANFQMQHRTTTASILEFQSGGNTRLNSDGNIYLNTNQGGGSNTLVRLNGNTISLGVVNSNATLTTQGTGDLTLSTNSGTNSGTIKISDGANGDINITPNGTGQVNMGNYQFKVDQSLGSGQDNYVLTYDDNDGTISFEAASGGGSTSPAGSDSQIQYNNGGSFGGDADFTWDDTNNRLVIGSTTSQHDSLGKLTVKGTDASFLLEKHDAGSSGGPTMTLYRYSSSVADGDLIGQVNFRGEGSTGNPSTYMSLRTEIVDTTEGTKDAKLIMRGLQGNTQTDFMEVGQKVQIGPESVNPSGITTGKVTISRDSTDETTDGPTLMLVDGDDDASPGPVIKLYRNTASPADNDVIGQLLFSGEDSAGGERTYGSISARTLDVTSGTRDSEILLKSTKDGADVTTLTLYRGEVKANLHVETYKPAVFMDSGNINVTTTEVTIPFDTEILDPAGNATLATGLGEDGHIRLVAGGYYRISYSIPINDDSTAAADRTRVFVDMQTSSSSAFSSFTTVAQSRAQVYTRENSGGSGLSTSFIYEHTANNYIRLRIDAQLGTDISTETNECQISIEYLGPA